MEALLETLPTAQERDELQRGLDDLIGFLTGLKESLQQLPPADSAEIQDVVLRLAAFLDRAEQSQTLGPLVGMKRTSPRAGRSQVASSSVAEAEALLTQLNELEEDAVRARLSASSLPELRGVAALLGIPEKRASRKALANQLASKVLNAQGYRLLREGVSE